MNKQFHQLNPHTYPHERTGDSVYIKWRSLNERYKKEKKLEGKFTTKAHETGSAAGMEVGEWKSTWDLFDLFHECCVEGNPADADEQEASGSIHCSALPGMPRPEVDNESGRQLCACMISQVSAHTHAQVFNSICVQGCTVILTSSQENGRS